MEKEKSIPRLPTSAIPCSIDDCDGYPHGEQTSRVIAAAIEVHRALGPGFLEAVYEEALSLELDHRQIPYERQRLVRVRYRGSIVGVHKVDLITEAKVVVELKAVKAIENIHLAITWAYLKAANLRRNRCRSDVQRQRRQWRLSRKAGA